MLSVEEAQDRILGLAPRLPDVSLPLAASSGHYLAAPLTALRTQPAHDLSAMDGYATRADDVVGPWRVIGESAAGKPFSGEVSKGQCVRISTGAVMPGECGAIILQENITSSEGHVTLQPGENGATPRHIRARGMDFVHGAILLDKGVRMTPARIALAAIAGHASVRCGSRPTLALVETGDELVGPGSIPLNEEQIPATNALMLADLLRAVPCEAAAGQPLPDRLDVISAHFERLVRADTDVIVSLGGASVGDHDLVRPALERIGAKVDFWKVAMRPGKPLMAARIRNTLFLGLPGNPVSAFVTAWLFLLPAIRHMAGCAQPRPKTVHLPLLAELPVNGPRRNLVRGTVCRNGVRPLGSRDSSAIHELAKANCLIELAENAPAMNPGTLVRVHLLRLD